MNRSASSPVLILIVLAQFCCTSLWFASNAVLVDLIAAFGLSAAAAGHLTSAVQSGFIGGTLCFAILTITDRFSPSRVFLCCAVLGSLTNGLMVWKGHSQESLLILRFLTGFCLAGIYPVGMKIAADHFDRGLGRSLGWLVGALVLGTAFPHLLRGVGGDLPWRGVVWVTTGMALVGGLLIGTCVPDGPYRKAGKRLEPRAFLTVFRHRPFRAAAFGYFGHMWELYAFWTFVPLLVAVGAEGEDLTSAAVSRWSFAIISIGGVACVVGGYLSVRYGPQRVAAIALALSGSCCLLAPLVLWYAPQLVRAGFLLGWGVVVVMDSPLFSTLVAQRAPAAVRGTALTIVNCLGFAITIVSIQLLAKMELANIGALQYTVLVLGPLFGLAALGKTGEEENVRVV